MANKRTVKKGIKQLRRVSTWQLVVLLILTSFISATFLRLNNIGMIQRRDAVLAADHSGDLEALKNRLYDLQRFSAKHMNTSTGGFYLEASFTRDKDAYNAQKSDDNSPHGNIFVKAQEVCAPRFSGWSMAYVQCVDQELAKYSGTETLEPDGQEPRVENYRHSFASPLWSPDFAGFSVLITLGVVIAIIARLVALGVLHGILRWRSREL